MKLAEDKPLPHKLMAAMAQLDCGSCGYVCKTYSAAIACGEETNLTLCSPGGKETKQMLKKLVKESETNGEASPLPNPVGCSAWTFMGTAYRSSLSKWRTGAK